MKQRGPLRFVKFRLYPEGNELAVEGSTDVCIQVLPMRFENPPNSLISRVLSLGGGGGRSSPFAAVK